MDKYQKVREIPLTAVFQALGVNQEWKRRKGGHEHFGRCPHPDHNPKQNNTSFSFDDTGRFHCFGCDWKGRGSIDAVQGMKRCGFQPAVEFLEGITPVAEQTPAISDSVSYGEGSSERMDTLKPLKSSYHKFAVPCPWLEARIPDMTVRDRFGVFQYNNPQRKSVYSGKVMLPILGTDGELYGYLARNPKPGEGEPKYLFPKGLPKHLFVFGAWQMMQMCEVPVKRLWLVESPFAVMKFVCLGLPAVSPFGWSVSPQQLDILCQLAKGVVYLPDRNKYGEGKAVAGLLASRLWVKYPELPEGCEDPESLDKQTVLAL